MQYSELLDLQKYLLEYIVLNPNINCSNKDGIKVVFTGVGVLKMLGLCDRETKDTDILVYVKEDGINEVSSVFMKAYPEGDFAKYQEEVGEDYKIDGEGVSLDDVDMISSEDEPYALYRVSTYDFGRLDVFIHDMEKFDENKVVPLGNINISRLEEIFKYKFLWNEWKASRDLIELMRKLNKFNLK